MSIQTRYYNYGSQYYSWDDNAAHYAVTPHGVYRGFGLGVDIAADLTIAAGYGCQPDGVIWAESDTTTVAFSPVAPATDYTVVALHADSFIVGGAEVTYELQTGILTTVVDGVILGWIYYPGGSIPLATTHLVQAPKMLMPDYVGVVVATKPIDRVAPFHNQNACYTQSVGPDINLPTNEPLFVFDAGNYVLYQSVANSNTAPGPEQVIQHFQFYMDGYRPSSFDFYLDVDTEVNTNLTVGLYGTDIAPVTITGSPIAGWGGGWDTKSITVDRNSGTFTVGEPYTLRLTYNLGVDQEIKLARVKANFWPYP